MGNLLSNFFYKNDYLGATFDFEKCKPSDEMRQAYDKAVEGCAKMSDVAEALTAFTGQDETNVRQAIEDPGNQTALENAFRDVMPTIELASAYEAAAGTAAETAIVVLTQLAKIREREKGPMLLKDQSFTRQVAKLMSAALISDLAKQSTPELLNDVTFYLRKESMLKNKGLLTVQRSRVESVRTVLVEQMGITSRIARLVAEKRSEDRGLVPTVAHFCTAAFNVVHASCFGERADENLIFLRAMTAAILIYDSTREGGVLGPGSAVNLRFILQFLKKNSARLLKQPELVAELGRVIKV